MTDYTNLSSPLGDLLATAEGGALTGLGFSGQRRSPRVEPAWRERREPFADLARQLDEYFSGRRTRFDLPVALRGTPFQLEVWRALGEIAYGATSTYGAVAKDIGRPSAVRAVAGAIGRNPVGIVVPCHRVIGSDGAITGYGGGVDRKARLLELEAL